MDYTLSQYKPETFEKLAHDLTVEKLVGVFGYPEVNDCQSKLPVSSCSSDMEHMWPWTTKRCMQSDGLCSAV